jgi:hypothetical protein
MNKSARPDYSLDDGDQPNASQVISTLCQPLSAKHVMVDYPLSAQK